MPDHTIIASSAYDFPSRSFSHTNSFGFAPSPVAYEHAFQDAPAPPATLRSPSTSVEVGRHTDLEEAGHHTAGLVEEVFHTVLAVAAVHIAAVVAVRIAAALHILAAAVLRTVVGVERRSLAVGHRIAEADHTAEVEEHHIRQHHLEALPSQDGRF